MKQKKPLLAGLLKMSLKGNVIVCPLQLPVSARIRVRTPLSVTMSARRMISSPTKRRLMSLGCERRHIIFLHFSQIVEMILHPLSSGVSDDT